MKYPKEYLDEIKLRLKVSQVVGAKEIKDWGGKVILIKCMKGKSTSKIIERIKDGT